MTRLVSLSGTMAPVYVPGNSAGSTREQILWSLSPENTHYTCGKVSDRSG
jgi:hypothetical protein